MKSARVTMNAMKARMLSNRTPALLSGVAMLQVLDWQSTLWAARGRAEANPLLAHLSNWLTFVLILSAVKLLFIAVLLGGYFYWRRHRGMYEIEFTACLTVLLLTYGTVVINNYRG